MKQLKKDWQVILWAVTLVFLTWGLVASGNRLLFTRAGRADFGVVQKRFIKDLPPGVCQSLKPTDHIEFRREAGQVAYRCSSLGGEVALWPFYESFESAQELEVSFRKAKPQ